MNRNKLDNTVKHLFDLLASKRYEELEKMSNGIRLKATEIETAIEDYGKTLISMPIQGYNDIDIIEIKNDQSDQWSVNVPVYTKEEGTSDLTLELTIIESPSDFYTVEIDGLHVL